MGTEVNELAVVLIKMEGRGGTFGLGWSVKDDLRNGLKTTRKCQY